MCKKYISKCYIHSSNAKTKLKWNWNMLNLYFNFVVPLCLLLIFSSYSVSCFFIFKAIFLEYFRLTTKLKRGTVNSHFLCTHKCISSHYQCQNIYICKYICIHTHTHTYIYIYIYFFFFFFYQG